MAYINGDWQYVYRVLGSSVSICEHSRHSYLFGFFAKKVNRYLRVNGNRNIHAPTKRSSDQSTRGGFVSWGHAHSVPKNYLQISPAPDGSPAGAPSVFCARRKSRRCAFCVSDRALRARSRWSAGTGSRSSSIGSRSSSPRRGGSAIASGNKSSMSSDRC